jgi:hypothetical protein
MYWYRMQINWDYKKQFFPELHVYLYGGQQCSSEAFSVTKQLNDNDYRLLLNMLTSIIISGNVNGFYVKKLTVTTSHPGLRRTETDQPHENEFYA